MKTLDQLGTNVEAIPEKMKRMKNWIVYGTNEKQKSNETYSEYIERTQVKAHPKNANEDQNKKSDETWTEYGQRTSAKSNDPTTWTTYEKAVEVARSFKGISGLGFELGTEENPSGIVAIDLDHCLNEDGQIPLENTNFVKEFTSFETYTERSISGDGLHLFVEGTIPSALPKHSKPAVEMYSFGRYILITGNKVSKNNEIKTNKFKLEKLYHKYKKMKDEEDKLKNAENKTTGEKILEATPETQKQDERLQQAFKEAIQKEADYLNELFLQDYVLQSGMRKTEHCLNKDDPTKHPHGDSNPSMKYNTKNANSKYYCFSCQQAFGIVDFIEKEYNLSSKREAINKIVELFKETEKIKQYYSFRKQIREEIERLKKQIELEEKQKEKENTFIEKLNTKRISFQIETFAEKTMQETFKPIPSGIDGIDEVLRGGFLKGSTVTIGGGTSTGKTTFALQVLQNIASEENPVLYFTLEMAELQILAKLLSSYIYQKTGTRHILPADEILQSYKLDKDKKEIVDFYSKQFMQNYDDKFFIIYPEEPTVEAIIDFAYKFKKATGKTPILAVDYLQYLQGKPREDQQTAIKRSTKEMKGFAIENETLCFVLFANNRESEKSKKATDISSGLGSSSIEYTADYQLTIGFTEYERKEGKKDLDVLKDENPRRMTITIQKNRLGPTGKKIDFLFFTEANYFHDKPKPKHRYTPSGEFR